MKGNILDHEFSFERDGHKVVEVSKRWFRLRDAYGIEVAPGQDDALILACTVCIDQMGRGYATRRSGAAPDMGVPIRRRAAPRYDPATGWEVELNPASAHSTDVDLAQKRPPGRVGEKQTHRRRRP